MNPLHETTNLGFNDFCRAIGMPLTQRADGVRSNARNVWDGISPDSTRVAISSWVDDASTHPKFGRVYCIETQAEANDARAQLRRRRDLVRLIAERKVTGYIVRIHRNGGREASTVDTIYSYILPITDIILHDGGVYAVVGEPVHFSKL